MNEKVLQLNHISKEYRGKNILSDVSLNIYKGEIYGLLGKNGIGKTTLLKIIVNIIPKNNFQGEMHITGSKKIGSVIENPACYMDLSVRGNLDIYSSLISNNRKGKIGKVIENFELSTFLDKKAKDLSLGMLQKLKLALAFLSDGDLLILDEPFNGLDIDGVISLRKQIISIHDKKDKAIIITSHNTAELDKLCDRFGVLHKGQVTEIAKEEKGDLEKRYLQILKDGGECRCC